MKKNVKKTAHCKPFAVATPNIVSLINDGHRPNARKQVGSTQKLKNAFLKNTILFLSFLILGFGSELKAQETPKWEIGTDMLWLVKKNTLPEYSLLVRRKLSDENVLRARIGTSTSIASGSIPRLWDRGDVMFRLGYERNKFIWEDKIIAYYGVDIHYSFGKKIMENNVDNGWRNRLYLGDDLYARGDFITSTNRRWGGILLAGIKYQFHKHFSVSTEVNFTVYRGKQSTIVPFEINRSPTDTRTTNVYASVSYWETLISPLSVLNFSFHF